MKILGLSGRKQSGKTSSANFLIGMEMKSMGLIEDFSLLEDGKLEVPITDNGEIKRGIFDWSIPNPNLIAYLSENLWPTLKAYSLADPLKYDVCMGLLGLSYEQCFGTDEQKNTPTRINWENVPGIVTKDWLDGTWGNILCDWKSYPSLEEYRDPGLEKGLNTIKLSYREPAMMTAREVMQHIGTNIFREMLPDIWIDTTIRRIQQEMPELAIVTDVRFPNEVEGIQKAGGKVIRLTLNPHNSQHESETALDNYDGFDAVIDNASLSMHEKNIHLYKILKEWSYLEYELILDNN